MASTDARKEGTEETRVRRASENQLKASKHPKTDEGNGPAGHGSWVEELNLILLFEWLKFLVYF